MSEEKPSTAQADALAKQLKQSLTQRRPSTWKIVASALAISVLLLGLLTWWLYPRGRTPPLQVIALDAIFTPEETPRARAQLLAAPGSELPWTWSGHTVVFQFPARIGEKPREDVVQSDELGQASIEAPATEFLAQFVNTQQKEFSVPDRGRIFVWAKESPLLLVDVDETLMDGELDARALATLKAANQEGWRIVYLSVASAQAEDFRAARVWIEKQANLPKGPVLARRHFKENETGGTARREVLRSLQNRFTGKVQALVKNSDSALICREFGLDTILIGDAAAAEVVQAPTWADVPVRLK